MKKLTFLASSALVGITALTPAMAQDFGSHTFRVSNGAAQDHPVSTGIDAMSSCLQEGSGGQMKLRAFYSGQLGMMPRRRSQCAQALLTWWSQGLMRWPVLSQQWVFSAYLSYLIILTRLIKS